VQNKDIADKIRYILEPAPASARFYRRKKSINPDVIEAEFGNEHVDLLLQLESKINTQSGKDFFWRLVGHSFILPLPEDAPDKSSLSPRFSSIRALLEQLCDYAFMVYIRANKIDEAFNGFSSRLKDYTSVNPINYKIFYCIYQVLLYELYRYSEDNLKILELMIYKYQLCISETCALRKKKEEAERKLALEEPIVTMARLLGTFPEKQSLNRSQVLPTDDLIANSSDLVLKLKDALKKARFELVRKELKGVSSEINQDKNRLITKYKDLRFSTELTEALESIDIEIEEPGSKFSYSRGIGFIRNIYEQSLREIALTIRDRTGKEIPKWTDRGQMGEALDYFRKIDFISDKEKNMLNGFSGLISDTGSHSLTSERYEVRIAKNILVEILSYLTDKMDNYLNRSAKTN
jgi:hypothetical protein